MADVVPISTEEPVYPDDPYRGPITGRSGTGVVNGNRVIPTEPVSLAVTIEAGRIRILGAPSDAAQSNVSLARPMGPSPG